MLFRVAGNAAKLEVAQQFVFYLHFITTPQVLKKYPYCLSSILETDFA
jgi:hypothetical protein